MENGYSSPLEVRTGLRQGDGVSPLLFNMALEGALLEIMKSNLRISITTKIGVPAFADDFVLAETREELQEMIKILIQETQWMGLKTNDSKTELPGCGWANKRKENLECINHEFEQAGEFKYLTTMVNTNNNQDVDIQNRVNLPTEERMP